MTASAEQRAEKLRNVLNQHNHRYFVLHDPVISDAEFDLLYDELKALEAQHPYLVTLDSPTQRAGSDLSTEFAKARHDRPILSLAKAFDADELSAWEERNRKLEPEALFRYTVEPKYDGLSIILRYEDGLLVQAATRGNGEVGDIITHNARTLPTIPLRIPVANGGPTPAVLVVRGEVLFLKEAFKALNRARAADDLPLYINARNTASGSLKQKDATKTAERDLTAFIYDALIVEGRILASRHEQLAYLEELGFLTPKEATLCEDLNTAIEHLAWWSDNRDSLPFEIDGVVIKLDDLPVYERLGVVGKEPRGAIAYKFPSSEETTTLREVQHQVGRSGRITPTAVLEPVFVGGVTVTHASLHNYEQIAALDIRLGDTIMVKRAGDVIPYVTGPVVSARTGVERIVGVPQQCPVCRVEIRQSPGMVDIYCRNQLCTERIFRRVVFFASRGGMNIEGLGPQTLKLLIKEHLIKNEADLFSLSLEQLQSLEGFAEKKAHGLLDSLEEAKSRPPEQLLTSLGIPGIGETVAKLLIKAFPGLNALRQLAESLAQLVARTVAIRPRLEREALGIAMRYARARDPAAGIQRALSPEFEACTEDDQKALLDYTTRLQEHVAPLYDLEGVGPTLVHQIVDWFNEADNGVLLDKLHAAGLQLQREPAAQTVGTLDGLSFVLTGALPTLSRVEAKAFIEQQGGSVKGSVSKKTHYVVAGENPGSKAAKAQALGISVITEEELRALT